MKQPSYRLEAADLPSVTPLFRMHHGYKSVGRAATYCFAVRETLDMDVAVGPSLVHSLSIDWPVAAWSWNPPPRGCALSVCPEVPWGVLGLSRMVAVPRHERKLKHISKPLRRQMKFMIDRRRWPVLVTFHDEGQGHNGFVYKCSGWTPTRRRRVPIYEDESGARRSTYRNGSTNTRGLKPVGHTYIQRWENWACEPGEVQDYMSEGGWERRRVPGTWASGAPRHRVVRAEAGVQLSLGFA